MKNPYVHTALIALGAFVVAAYIQQNLMAVPVIGAYLPGGKAA